VIVAEPIALQLRREVGDIYLPTQIFTGCVFLLAAICSWGVRTWKINEERKRQDCRQYREEDCLSADVSWDVKVYAHLLSVFSKGKV
jgi:hypothetical protein